MNTYKNKKIILTGYQGFIGSALDQRLASLGAEVYPYYRDVREPIKVDGRFDYCFHFAGPSSQVLFDRSPNYCIETTITGFVNVNKYCVDNGVKLIYPSTGLLNQPIQNDYSKCKALCESIAAKSNAETLGVRIFAGYGPGEIAKRDYASVITLFLRDMMEGKPPIVFGDGSQKRDFIYITDIVDLILATAETKRGIIEAGSGEPFSFNHVILVINETIGKNIQPIYQGKPDNYIEETKAGITLGHKFVTLRDGIKHLYQAYKKL